MRLLPRSLTGRLLVTAGCALLFGITVAAIGVAGVLQRFVMQSLDTRLDTQILLLAQTLERDPDHAASALHNADLPPFDHAGTGWTWRVMGSFGVIRSASSDGGGDNVMAPPPFPHPGSLFSPPPPHGPPPFAPDPEPRFDIHGTILRIRPMDGRDSTGRPVHYRVAVLNLRGGKVTIAVAAPRGLVAWPLRAAVVPLLESVLAMTGVMLVALAIQIRIGLRPVRRLRDMVAEIRTGRSRRFTIMEPTELLPLIEELNALIVANERTVALARTHVSNLAHGLKTPLAALKLDLAGGPEEGVMRSLLLVERMERQIRHHLGRARAAAGGSVASPSVLLRPHIEDLSSAMSRIHADTPRCMHLEVADDVSVRCDPQDLDELLGNLLDNARRHATTQVRLSALRDEARVVILIEDDGPGLSHAEIAIVVQEGRRLDEKVMGWGFGLAISRELCELHGGSLMLERSSLGGLTARVALDAG